MIDGSFVCPRCTPEITLDESQPQRVLTHIGAHVLHDNTLDLSTEPCGLCLRPSNICKFYLSKGKGSNGNTKVDKTRTQGCPNMVSFAYNVAAESTKTSPCSNVPITCPLCPSASPAIWRYNARGHFIGHIRRCHYQITASSGSLQISRKAK